MKTPKHPTLIRRFLQARQKQLQAKSPVLAASLVTIRRACGNPNCRCARGHKHPGHPLPGNLSLGRNNYLCLVDRFGG